MSDLVYIEIDNGKIRAKIPYWGGTGRDLAKSIPGCRPKFENNRFKAWVYPLDLSVCYRMREVFGDKLRVGTELAAWARKEIAAAASQLDLRSATDAELERVPVIAPALAKAMESRKYQRVGARFAVDGGQVLIADEPGTGKTLETLAALVETDAKKVLVFCKKKAIETVWAPEAVRWLGDDVVKVYPIVGSAVARQLKFRSFIEARDDRMQIVVGNIEMVRRVKTEHPCQYCPEGKKQNCENRKKHKRTEEAKYPELFETEWDAIVVDESHKALIGRHTMSNSVTQTRLGMMRLKLAKGGMKLALSGTPGRGKPENIWGTLNWLRPDVFTSLWRFVADYFDVEKNEYGGHVIKGIDPARAAAYDATLARYMIRRTKEEVAPDMPSRQYGGTPLDPTDPESTIGVWLDLEPAAAKTYAKIREDGIVKLDGRELFVNGLLAELTRRKQFAVCDWKLDDNGALVPANPANSSKYQWLKEFVEERAEAGKKIVVASQFSKVVEAFSAWLKADGIASYTLTGATSERAATANVAAFNDPSDPVPVFLINTMAGGESINLDRCADDVVFLDETFIPEDQEQVENRIHRMSRIHQVTVWYLRSRGTVEEAICRTTGARDAIMRGRLDGSRGVDFKRRLLFEDQQPIEL